jgi:hypothetical protein
MICASLAIEPRQSTNVPKTSKKSALMRSMDPHSPRLFFGVGANLFAHAGSFKAAAE